MGVGREDGESVGEGGGTEAGGEGREIEQAVDGTGEGVGVARGDEKGVFAIAKVVDRAGGAGGDDGFAERHGFEEDHLADGAGGGQERKGDDGGGGEGFTELGNGEFAEDGHVGGDGAGKRLVAGGDKDDGSADVFAGGEEGREVPESAAGADDGGRRGGGDGGRRVDGGADGDEADAGGGNAPAVGYGGDFERGIDEDAEGVAGDETIECGFESPEGGTGTGIVQKDFAEDLAGRTEGGGTEEAVGKGGARAHGDDGGGAGGAPPKAEGLNEGGEGVGRFAGGANGGGGVGPARGLEESLVGENHAEGIPPQNGGKCKRGRRGKSGDREGDKRVAKGKTKARAIWVAGKGEVG